jgi:protein-L-isoaspartate(D-aspartate) O-methyltransferase
LSIRPNILGDVVRPDDLDQEKMVVDQIESRGVHDPDVLSALRSVPRQAFVPEHLWSASFVDNALPIGHCQTISQPYIVGKMTELLQLERHHTVLEIGTGSGYQAAVLSTLVDQVVSVEIIPSLADAARVRLKQLGYVNVRVRSGDGFAGWREHGPYDRICLTAAPDVVPDAIPEQLKVGGRMVAPVGERHQRLVVWIRRENGFDRSTSIGVRFVPMTGKVREKA